MTCASAIRWRRSRSGASAATRPPADRSRVVFPKGFTVAVQAGSIPKPVTDATGRVIFHSGTLSNPLSFFAYLVADRPGAYTSTARKATVEGDPVELTMQSWPDDKAWSKRVGDLMAKALPVLGDRVGLAWPQAPTLTVREAVSHSTGGYAGLFDPAKGLVEIAYYADPFVVLHESAHGWFNGSLLADRWANEGFASYYALQAAAALKVKATGDVLTTKLKAARIPLNAWGPIGRDTGATEDYAYAASLALAKAIGERATPDVLQAVWADAAGHVGAYQPPSGGTPETVERRAGLARPPRPPRDRERERLRRPVADLGGPRRGPAAARRPGRRPRAVRPGRRRCR